MSYMYLEKASRRKCMSVARRTLYIVFQVLISCKLHDPDAIALRMPQVVTFVPLCATPELFFLFALVLLGAALGFLVDGADPGC